MNQPTTGYKLLVAVLSSTPINLGFIAPAEPTTLTLSDGKVLT